MGDAGRTPLPLEWSFWRGRPPWAAVPRLVTTGAHDTFLPPRRLAPAVRTMLGTDLHVIPDAGHLVIEEHPGRLAALV
ncbi:alpha/beta fold hydrolase [Streptomyces sp. NPDC054961]